MSVDDAGRIEQTAAMKNSGSDEMVEIGIVQEPSPVLHDETEPYDLPAEADLAAEHLEQLRSAADKVFSAHQTKKGLGIAGPQLGINRRIAIMRPYGGHEVCLLNSVVIDRSQETDVKFEGCLSLFDVRGLVERPLSIVVQFSDMTGRIYTETFMNENARLVCHEIDHLDGCLYVDRVVEAPISVDEYRQRADTDWTYASTP